jgi:competence protein ComEC
LIAAHPRHAIATALAAGLALAQLDSLLLFSLAALAVVMLTAGGARAHVALAAAAMLLLGAGVGAARLASIDADPLAAVAGRGPVTLRGPLVQLPHSDQHGTRLRIRATGSNQLLEVQAREQPNLSLQVGQVVVVRGRVRSVDPSDATSDEAKSYAQYLLRNGVRRRMTASELTVTGGRRGGAYGVVDAIRSRAENALAFGLAPEPAALLRGMVLGGDAALPEATAEDFRVAGLSHILAVSGQNVLLIVILVLAILTAAGAPRAARIAVSAVVIVIYVLLCGAQASVIRAGAMGLAALVALAASRPASRSYALILAAIAVLLTNPRASADVGAQLSFAAVLGIIAFTAPLAARLTRVPRWIAEAFAATFGATLATAPLMAYHFEAVSIVSLAANVLGEPLIAPIVWLGSLTAAIGQISQPLAALLGGPNQFLLGALIELAHAAASVPGAQVEAGGFGPAGLIFGFVLVIAAAAAVNGEVRLPAARAPLLAAAILICAALAAPLPGRANNRPQGPAIAMLDVGQGDAMLLLGQGCSALVDSGPPGGGLEKELKKLGVEQLDALLITHAEDDHFGGALELARKGKLHAGTLIDGGGETPRGDFAELRAKLRAQGAKSIPAVTGARWSCPGIEIHVIGPAPLPPGAPQPANANERAAVSEIAVGSASIFSSGDAESQFLTSLPVAPAEIIKVAHHGSADPGLAALLQRTSPRVALIGVGEHNRYGHPTPDTLSMLKAAGVTTFRTDQGGTILLRPGADGSLRVERAR